MKFLQLPLIKFGEVDKVLDEVKETASFHSTGPARESLVKDSIAQYDTPVLVYHAEDAGKIGLDVLA